MDSHARSARRALRGARRSPRTVALAASALGLLLAACGGGSSEEVPGQTDTSQFHPPPIPTEVADTVQQACDVSSPTLDRIREDGALFWAIGVTPPFGFRVGNGEWAGVEAQNAAELAAILGVDYEITEYSYDLLPTAVATGQADIIGAQLFVTDERKEVIDFSEPYYQAGQLFYVLEDSPYQTIDDLNQPDVRFIYGFGTAQLLLAEKYVPRAQETDAPLSGQLLLGDYLADDQADATMTDASAMRVVFKQFPDPPLAA
ncbi:MAG: transporter substrate-binding domain-containing protein, partial [Aeromicrobium sp.]